MGGCWKVLRIWELFRGRDGDTEVTCEGQREAKKADEVGDSHFGGCEGDVVGWAGRRRKLEVRFASDCTLEGLSEAIGDISSSNILDIPYLVILMISKEFFSRKTFIWITFEWDSKGWIKFGDL
jgi:hypothetical protein